MTTPPTRSTLDVRAIPGTHETIAYKDGGLFPVIARIRGNVIVAALRGGAGHLGRAGRMEVIRSLDTGRTWTPPLVVADTEVDDRNPAFGYTPAGTLVLAYHRQPGYDADGNYTPAPNRGEGAQCVQVMITRSHDDGLTWEAPYPLGIDALAGGSPFGKIVVTKDNTLLMPVYDRPVPALAATSHPSAQPTDDWSFVVRSQDDGRTWHDPTLIAPNKNETALLVLPDGDLLAVMRGAGGTEDLAGSRSEDHGLRWSPPVQITGTRQHPADLVLLANGDVLCTYGNRTPPYRIEGLISRDGGRSWLDCLLIFSGHLYGYDLAGPRSTDLGYPSSVVLDTPSGGRGVTLYYYNPSIGSVSDTHQRAGNALFTAQNYYAIAVTWDEAELIAAVDRTVGNRE